MNNIVIDNNILYGCNSVNVDKNNIEFISNGEYKLEIINSDRVDINIVIKDNVCVKLFIFGSCCDINSKIVYKLGYSSNLILFKFYNNKRMEEIEDIYLDGKYSKISYNFSSICFGVENYKIRVFHNNNCVDSYISNKCIGYDGSKVSFFIDSILGKGNTGCKMDQDTRVICMGDVDSKISPNMYIEEDDVEARHGSVIGRFNEDDIFYLMSRGINEEEVIKLMVKGFILSHLVIDMESRSKILSIINGSY